MRILALVPGGISEQLLFFPTLASLKSQYPKAAIDVIVEPRSKSAYRVCPQVQEVLVFDFRDRTGLADYLNLLGIIRDREYEASLSTDSRWSTELLLWLNGIPLRVGYQTGASWFLSQTVPYQPHQYTAHFYHDLVQGFGINNPCPPLQIAVPKEDILWAEQEQQRLGLANSRYIVIPAAPSYPTPLWLRIIADIQKRQSDLGIVLVSGPGDEAWVKAIQKEQVNLQVSRPGDVGKLAALIAGANLMLCTEGAALYLAIAVGTYTIVLASNRQVGQRLPSQLSQGVILTAPTGSLDQISPDKILQQVWGN